MMKAKTLFLLIILLMVFIPITRVYSTEWANSSFKYRNIYVINSDLVDEQLYDFPVLVYLNSSYINWDRVNDDLSDLRFYNVSNNLISHEIDSYTENVDAWLWVKIPYISNVSNTYFYLYYGCFYAESVENAEDVWSNGFVGVWHMNDATTSNIKDSTSNGNDGTKKGVNEPIEVNGQIGKAQDFDGINDKITHAYDASLDIAGNITFVAYVRPDKITDIQQLSYRRSWLVGGWMFRINTDKLEVTIEDATGRTEVASSAFITDGDFWHLVATLNIVDQKIYFYGNGEAKGSATCSRVCTATPATAMTLGIVDVYQPFFGLFDEFQLISNTVSSAWVSASYKTQNLNLISLIETETFNEDYMVFGIIAIVIALFSFVMVITYNKKGEK